MTRTFINIDDLPVGWVVCNMCHGAGLKDGCRWCESKGMYEE